MEAASAGNLNPPGQQENVAADEPGHEEHENPGGSGNAPPSLVPNNIHDEKFLLKMEAMAKIPDPESEHPLCKKFKEEAELDKRDDVTDDINDEPPMLRIALTIPFNDETVAFYDRCSAGCGLKVFALLAGRLNHTKSGRVQFSFMHSDRTVPRVPSVTSMAEAVTSMAEGVTSMDEGVFRCMPVFRQDSLQGFVKMYLNRAMMDGSWATCAMLMGLVQAMHECSGGGTKLLENINNEAAIATPRADKEYVSYEYQITSFSRMPVQRDELTGAHIQPIAKITGRMVLWLYGMDSDNWPLTYVDMSVVKDISTAVWQPGAIKGCVSASDMGSGCITPQTISFEKGSAGTEHPQRTYTPPPPPHKRQRVMRPGGSA